VKEPAFLPAHSSFVADGAIRRPSVGRLLYIDSQSLNSMNAILSKILSNLSCVWTLGATRIAGIEWGGYVEGVDDKSSVVFEDDTKNSLPGVSHVVSWVACRRFPFEPFHMLVNLKE